MSDPELRSRVKKGGRLPPQVRLAASAALDKNASDVVVLDLRKAGGFTDFFVICSGRGARHIKTIADAIEESLIKSKVKPAHVEGYDRAEWVLLDYFDFVVHIFTPEMRMFYALDRLWGSAEKVTVGEEPGAGASV